jgi:signal transduction histidine kinase
VFKDENAPDVLVDDVVREFPYRRGWVQLTVLGLLVIATIVIVRRRIRPIAEVSRIAGTIGPQTLDMRLPERNLPAEVEPIVHAVNGAFERLDRAAGAQREFLRRAAHQLRTPLTVLSARAETLDNSETASQLRGDIKEIARMITQLLQLHELDSSPERGELFANLGAVGEAVRDELREKAAACGRRIDLVQPDEPVLVRGDPNIIEVAVRNLVENAIRHAPLGGVVTIGVEKDGRMEVANAGPGIPEELQDKIFEPFWSGDPDGRQSGLGLTIVRRIADHYGAAITVDSAADRGTVFRLAFQLASPDPSRFDPVAAKRSIPASLARRRSDLRVDETTG